MKNQAWTTLLRSVASPLLCAVSAAVLLANASGCRRSSQSVAVGEAVGVSKSDPSDRLSKAIPEQKKCVTKGESGVHENFACYIVMRSGVEDDSLRIAYTADSEATIPAVVETLRAAMGDSAIEVKKISADEYHALQARLR